ncbi:hypothetical protein OB952_20795 [Aeromonas salmonicida]|nr:hypothetical protein [Aeromonas salmonicida]MDM5069777.1 hypothetical protein [Aeromonas salmonicida]
MNHNDEGGFIIDLDWLAMFLIGWLSNDTARSFEVLIAAIITRG